MILSVASLLVAFKNFAQKKTINLKHLWGLTTREKFHAKKHQEKLL
jgi:hypothetical protein